MGNVRRWGGLLKEITQLMQHFESPLKAFWSYPNNNKAVVLVSTGAGGSLK
jgi:hypothetical protein